MSTLSAETLAKVRDSNTMSLVTMDRIKHTGMLHSSTSPEAIFAAQRDDVLRYIERFARNRPKADEISRELVLPLWNVERCLAAIEGREMNQVEAAGQREINKVKVIAYLKTVGSATVPEIAQAIDGNVGSIRWLVCKEKTIFVGKHANAKRYRNVCYLWSLR